MRANSTFKSLSTANLGGKSELTLQIDGMRGVDLTNSPLFVDKTRASDMANFIMENGVIQKRNGWKEVMQYDAEINGVWQLDATVIEGNNKVVKKHVIMMVGTNFYNVEGFDTETPSCDKDNPIPLINFSIESKIKNEVAYGVVGGEKLYILCGDFITIGYYNNTLEVHRVEDDIDTFIPTTTISIPAIGNNAIQRTPYDDINMLTRWRYNSLVGNTPQEEIVAPVDETGEVDNSVEYILDAICTNLETVEVSILQADGSYLELTESEFKVENTKYENMDCTKLTLYKNYEPLIEGQDNIKVKFEVYDALYGSMISECKFGVLYGYDNVLDRLFFSGNDNYPNMVFRSNESTGSDQQDFTYFSPLDYIKLGNTTNKIMGMSILGDGTLCVLKSPSGQEPTIYFINAIMVTATDREGNTVYVDGVPQIEEQYQTRVGTIGEGLVNTSSLQTLAGDLLMLSNNGIFGVVLGSNVATSQRYAKCRSRLINGEIVKDREALKNAVCYVHDNKYYMAIGNKCYVGDGRYPYTLTDGLDGEYQYEWFVWNNIPARLFFSYNNELYFGTTNGHIMHFENKNFVDTTYTELKEGELMYDQDTGLFYLDAKRVSDIEKIHDNDIMEIKFDDPQIYALFLNQEDFEADTEKNVLVVKKPLEHQYVAQMASYIFYFDSIDDSKTTIIEDKPYLMVVSTMVDETVEENDDILTTITFYEAIEDAENRGLYYQGSQINVGEGKYRICYRLTESNVITDVQTEYNGETIYYKDVVINEDDEYEVYDDEGNIKDTYAKTDLIFNRFKIRTYTTELSTHDIVLYRGNSYNNLKCKFYFNEPVVCYFVTAVFNLGSVVYSKNVKQLIIVPDTLLGTEVDFGYETKSDVRYFNAYTGKSFNFDELDFDNLSFESEGFAKAYIKRTRIKNINFIRFIFKNSSDNNCKISNLTVVYEFGKKNKGVA